MSRKHKLIFKGTSKQLNYVGGGRDGKEDYIIDCKQGDTIYVTEEMKAGLLKDHPEWFVDIRDDAPEKPQQLRQKPILPANESGADWEEPTDKVTPIDYSLKELEAKTNAELREIAGTDDKRLSKRKLIKLIKPKK